MYPMPPPKDWLLNEFAAFPGNAFREATSQLQTSDPLVACIGIGAMSAITLHLADVSFNGGVFPAAESVNVIAPRGQGKSSAIELLASQLLDDGLVQDALYKIALKKYDEQLADSNMVEEALTSRVKTLLRQGKSAEEAMCKLSAHRDTPRPVEPRNARLVHVRLSEAALLKRIDGANRCIAIIAEEAGHTWRSALISETLNQLIDGSGIPIADFNKQSTSANPRLSMTLAVQPGTFFSVLKDRRVVMFESGLTARLLHALVDGTVPDGLINKVPGPYVLAFRKRMADLIQHIHGGAPRRTLTLNSAALNRCAMYARDINVLRKPGELLSGIPDFAARIIEHTVRLASVIHVFTQEGDVISEDLIDRAFNIVRFFAHQYIRIFSTTGPTHDLNQAIEDLEEFFRRKYRAGISNVQWTTVLKGAPEPRLADRYRPAINALIHDQRVFQILTPGKTKCTESFQLTPYFGNPMSAFSREPVTAQRFSEWYPRPLRNY